MPMPLDGIRVIDWTIWQQGPVASLMLGDLGADVIKIEERVGGDPGRGEMKAQGLDLRDRTNFYFEASNHNKRNLTVDLKKPAGVALVQRLAERADVFVQNFRMEVAARRGATLPTRSGTTTSVAMACGSPSACSSPTATGPVSARCSRSPRRRPTRASRPCSIA